MQVQAPGIWLALLYMKSAYTVCPTGGFINPPPIYWIIARIMNEEVLEKAAFLYMYSGTLNDRFLYFDIA